MGRDRLGVAEIPTQTWSTDTPHGTFADTTRTSAARAGIVQIGQRPARGSYWNFCKFRTIDTTFSR